MQMVLLMTSINLKVIQKCLSRTILKVVSIYFSSLHHYKFPSVIFLATLEKSVAFFLPDKISKLRICPT